MGRGRVTGGATKVYQAQPGGSVAKGGASTQVQVGDASGAQNRINQIQDETRLQLYDRETGKYIDKFADSERTKDLKKQNQDAEMSRLYREIDYARGAERAEKEFGDGALGRVYEADQDRTNALTDKRLEIAENGFGAEAFQKAREARLSNLQREQQLQRRNLGASLSSSGVFGGLAGAQKLALADQQLRSNQDAERTLFLDNVSQTKDNLDAAQADSLARQKYNQAQKKAEIMGRLSTSYGEAALGVTERSSARTAAAAEAYAKESANQGGGGKK